MPSLNITFTDEEHALPFQAAAQRAGRALKPLPTTRWSTPPANTGKKILEAAQRSAAWSRAFNERLNVLQPTEFPCVLILHSGAGFNYEIRNIVCVGEKLQKMGVKVNWENIGDPAQDDPVAVENMASQQKLFLTRRAALQEN